MSEGVSLWLLSNVVHGCVTWGEFDPTPRAAAIADKARADMGDALKNTETETSSLGRMTSLIRNSASLPMVFLISSFNSAAGTTFWLM